MWAIVLKSSDVSKEEKPVLIRGDRFVIIRKYKSPSTVRSWSVSCLVSNSKNITLNHTRATILGGSHASESFIRTKRDI